MTDIKTIAADIAQELREHPERWTKGEAARDANGMLIGARNPNAVCWCLRGHILRRTPETGVYRDVEEALMEIGDLDSCIPYWNDADERTVADVIALCERVAGDPTPCPKCQKAGEHKAGCERGTEP